MLKRLLWLFRGFVCACWRLRVRAPVICAIGARKRYAGCRLYVQCKVPRPFYKRWSWEGNITVHVQLSVGICVSVCLKSTVHSSFVVLRQKCRMFLRFLRVVHLHFMGSVFCLSLRGVCLFANTGKNCCDAVYLYNLNTILETHLEWLLPYAS